MCRARRKQNDTREVDALTRASGFTLVELAVVLALAGLIMAIAIPQLMPTILLSNLRGSARHMAGYGRAAMAHAAIAHERLTIRINLTPPEGESQEYWTVRWFTEYELREGGDGLFGDSAFGIVDPAPGGQRAQNVNAARFQPGSAGDATENARALQERFDRFATLTLQSQARHVKHDGLLSSIGPLFEGKEFSFNDTDEDSVDEVKTPLLERTRLPHGVQIESVRVGRSEISSGLVEIDVTPLGLTEPVHIYLKGKGDDDYVTVSWDPITGSSQIYDGKEDPL